MAELLLYNRPEWCNNYDDKYPDRYRIGDVIEVGEDGKWSKSKGWGAPKFKLLIVPGKRSDYLYLLDEDKDETTVYQRRKKTVTKIENAIVSADEKIEVSKIEDVTITDKEAERIVKEAISK